MERINYYLDKILYGQLRDVNMPYRFIKLIQDDIRLRMPSCLTYWNEREVRKTILLPSCEEAMFYEPNVTAEDVREFVITTIRNSKLEIAASDDCAIFKLPEPITDIKMKEITSVAIRYFGEYDLSVLAKEIEKIETEENVYKRAFVKYPLAWRILYRLANSIELQSEIEEKTISGKKEQIVEVIDPKGIRTTVCNGFTLEFDANLREAIGEVITGMVGCFYTDCFKMVSRNFEKLLHVLEIILENDAVFCTCNYYISCNYIAKRKHILRAAHNSEDVIKNMNAKGAPDKIKECIKMLTGED